MMMEAKQCLHIFIEYEARRMMTFSPGVSEVASARGLGRCGSSIVFCVMD